MPVDLRGEIHGESSRHIGVVRLDCHAQQTRDRTGMKFIAAHRRRIGPLLSVNVHAAGRRVISFADTRRENAQVGRAGELRIGGNVAQAVRWQRGRATVVQGAGGIIIEAIEIHNAVGQCAARRHAAGGITG